MKILLRLLARVSDFSDVQPIITLFLGGALLAVFLTATLHRTSRSADPAPSGLAGRLYHQIGLWLWALFLVTSLLGGLSALRSYLHQTVANFQQNHGRITEANYNAVQTIWGAEQNQGELNMNLYYEEQETNRIESEDPTKPAILRTKTVRHDILSNPFVSATHEVTLKQNSSNAGTTRNPFPNPQTHSVKFPNAVSPIYPGLSLFTPVDDVFPPR